MVGIAIGVGIAIICLVFLYRVIKKGAYRE